MRVLAIGGSGGMGRYAVRTTETFQEVESIVVADLNKEEAKKFADTLGPKVSGRGLDVLNEESLNAAVKEADVVLNTCGPFFRLAEPILASAIKYKTDYLDICDDWEPTWDMMEMDQEAKENDVCAIIGLGASPGLSNLLGLIACNELDSVKKVYTGWSMASAKPEKESSQTGANAAMVHAIQQMIGKVKIFQDGKYQNVRPLTEVEITYPGLGEFKSRIFGHPEAITFPKYFPDLKESINLAHDGEMGSSVLKWILRLVEWNLLPINQAASIFQSLEEKSPPPTNKETTGNQKRLPSIYGLAEGLKNGKEATVGVTFETQSSSEDGQGNPISLVTSMGASTGIPLACGLKLLLQGKVTEKGVFAPESGVLDPKDLLVEFVSVLQEQGDVPPAEDLIKVSRSWE